MAVYWCINCPHLLCENCYGHHKVLKATQSHKILSIDDYHMIGISIDESETYCPIHPTMRNKFFCVTHKAACCNTCKEETHGTECNVKLKKKLFKITDVQGDMNAMIETTKNIVENIRTGLLNDFCSVSDLENQKQIIFHEIKNSRQQVEKFLNEFERGVKEKLELACSAATKALIDNKENIEQKLNVIQKRTDTAEKIKESAVSGFQMFLIKNKFHTDYIEDQMQIECLLKEMKNVHFVAKPMYDLNHQANQITIRNGYEVRGVGHSLTGKKQQEFDDIEFSSSTVEADEGTVDKCVRSEKDIIPNDYISEHIITKESEKYKLNEHFLIERVNKDVCVICVRFLSSNKIVLTDDFVARVLVYNTNGSKVGQVKLKEAADEMTVIDETCIAVSLENEIVFLDVLQMKIKKKKLLDDYIEALSYANNKIYACMQHKGVLIMDLSGNILQTLPYIKGHLYICTTVTDILYSVIDENSNTLQCHYIDRKKIELFNFECSGKVNGIACDKDENVYIVIDNSKVIKFHNTTKTFSTVLTANDGLNNPLNIDCCDNGNRLLIINDGNVVNIYDNLNK
ncbi:Hypothetical predicted protein [Mytilus galloprovincialis]|uniref:B box-type domain-containing protein n=1 Tax=Mytilus galloprovincialis TaxID=29158 RepID=A0A8B6CEE9_MYTGA|nr:Hypothetical predicted protein [Mytilus galloprovincialis]